MQKKNLFIDHVNLNTVFYGTLFFFENKAFADQSRIDNFSKSYNLSKNPAQNMINIALAQQDKTGSLLGYTGGMVC